MSQNRGSTDEVSDSLMSRRVTFPAADGGPSLKGVLHLPEEGSGPFPAAVVCHPHTMMGGNMGNGIVVSLCLELTIAGWAALRFDFRGAGGSEGSFDGGDGWTRPPKEMDDVKGAADFLFVQGEIDPSDLVVMGYSFGAAVALHHAARDHRFHRMVGIALVKQHYNDPFLDSDRRPKLFIAGEEDPWAPVEAFRGYVDGLKPPKKLHVVGGADHLFSEHVREVTNVTVEWLTG